MGKIINIKGFNEFGQIVSQAYEMDISNSDGANYYYIVNAPDAGMYDISFYRPETNTIDLVDPPGQKQYSEWRDVSSSSPSSPNDYASTYYNSISSKSDSGSSTSYDSNYDTSPAYQRVGAQVQVQDTYNIGNGRTLPEPAMTMPMRQNARSDSFLFQAPPALSAAEQAEMQRVVTAQQRFANQPKQDGLSDAELGIRTVPEPVARPVRPASAAGPATEQTGPNPFEQMSMPRQPGPVRAPVQPISTAAVAPVEPAVSPAAMHSAPFDPSIIDGTTQYGLFREPSVKYGPPRPPTTSTEPPVKYGPPRPPTISTEPPVKYGPPRPPTTSTRTADSFAHLRVDGFTSYPTQPRIDAVPQGSIRDGAPLPADTVVPSLADQSIGPPPAPNAALPSFMGTDLRQGSAMAQSSAFEAQALRQEGIVSFIPPEDPRMQEDQPGAWWDDAVDGGETSSNVSEPAPLADVDDENETMYIHNVEVELLADDLETSPPDEPADAAAPSPHAGIAPEAASITHTSKLVTHRWGLDVAKATPAPTASPTPDSDRSEHQSKPGLT